MLVSWNRSFRKVGRDATRRRKETVLLSDLVKSLPLQEMEVEYVTQNDALNLAIQYIRLLKMINSEVPGQKYVKSEDLWLTDILKQKTKFLLVVEKSGTIMYASERMTQLLGLLQVSVIGAHFHEVVNVEDQDDFSLLLNDKTVWSRLIVMKCGSPSRGKHKSKVIHVSVLRRCDEQEFPFVVLECEPFERVPILELVIGASMEFTVNAYTRIVLDTDWKFELLSGFGRKQFIGTNMMQYVYPTDVEVSRDMHMQVVHSVINKGVYHQLPYRVLSGHGVWYWNTMEIRPSKVRNGKVIEMKCRIIILRPYIPEEGVYYSRKSTAPLPPTLTRKDITLPPRSASNVSVDYSSLHSLSDLPTSNPPSVCSSSGCSSGEVSCSTEPLSDLSVEDVLGPPNDTLPSRSVSNVSVDYSNLHSLSDLPTSNPPSVCSSSGCSSGEVSCSTEPLSDLSVEDVLGPPNDTSNDSSSHFQQVQHGQFLSNPPPSLPYESNVTGDIMELLLH